MYKTLILSILLASVFFLLLLSVNSDKEIGFSQNSSYAADSEVQSTKSTDSKAYIKPSEEELREKLTPLQYQVTQENATEKAYENEYWNNKKDGIYVDIVSGEPLFSSLDKYDSRTGWPSFTKPLQPENILEIEDRSLSIVRIKARSKDADSHLGHVFNDGPPPTGLRYCINSAALVFIPKKDLEKKGYGEYLELFER